MVGLKDLKGLFQTKCFCDAAAKWEMSARLWCGTMGDEGSRAMQVCARRRYHRDESAKGNAGKCSCSQKAVFVGKYLMDVRKTTTDGIKGKS